MIETFIISYKAWFAATSVILGLGGLIPYIRSIFLGQTRPHIFSWLIWSITMFIAFAAQMSDGAKFGAIHTGFSATVCLFVCFLSVKHGEKDITRSDIYSLIFALTAIPLWMLTNNALYAVLIALSIDVTGFYPTVRKSILKPNEENATAYFFSAASFFFAILSINNYSAVTLTYPFVIMLLNVAFPAYLLLRRKSIARLSAL